MRITLAKIVRLKPCYTVNRLADLFGTRRSVSARDIAGSSVSHNDKIWVLTRLMTSAQQRQFAADCARRVLHLVTDEYANAVCDAAIQTAEAFSVGQASGEDLAAAYADAAYAAAAYAAAAYAAAAYAAAAYAAAAYADAAYADAGDAERWWQLDRAAWYLDGDA